jgi:uncharacterized protein
MRVLDALGHALAVAGTMAWEIAWSLILGFALSAVVQALVQRQTITRLLGDDKPGTLALATGLGAASSSCSYAAVALARSLFRKGASFTSAMVFEIASTNLVIELGIILALLISWQFTLAEYAGGVVMIVTVAAAFRLFARRQLIDAARKQADRGLAGSMEGHAAMEMSISSGGGFWRRLTSARGYTAVSEIFVMEWAAVIRDMVGGLLIAGAVGAWVPGSFWRHLFLTGHPLAARLWGPLIGPVISLLSFVCSIGNVPLAGVLWNGGISFGGVTAFIFADLIIIPILVIYRKYYGTKMMLTILGIFYGAMVVAGYVIEFLFGALGLIPHARAAKVTEQAIQWNYTTALNIVFLLVAAALVVRFFRAGGGPMLRMMNGSPDGGLRRSGALARLRGHVRRCECWPARSHSLQLIKGLPDVLPQIRRVAVADPAGKGDFEDRDSCLRGQCRGRVSDATPAQRARKRRCERRELDQFALAQLSVRVNDLLAPPGVVAALFEHRAGGFESSGDRIDR